MPLFGQDGGCSGISAIHVQPHAVFFCDGSNGRHRIDAGGGSCAHCRNHAKWPLACALVFFHHARQSVHAHAEFGVRRDLAHVLLANANGNSAFFDGGMRLVRSVKRKIIAASGRPRFWGHELPRADNRVHAAGGSRVINDAEPLVCQAHPLPQPVQRALFQFCHGRRRHPVQSVGVERRGQHLAENRRRGTGAGKVGKETRMVPLRYSRHHQPVKIAQDGIKRLAFFRPRLRQRIQQVARFCLRQHRHVRNVAQVFGYPIHGLMAGTAEVFHIRLPLGLLLGCCRIFRINGFGISGFAHAIFRAAKIGALNY